MRQKIEKRPAKTTYMKLYFNILHDNFGIGVSSFIIPEIDFCPLL